MSAEILASLLPTAAGLVAVWVRMQNEIGKLKARLHYLEGDQDELKRLLQTVNEAVQEIKLILAKNQL